MQLHENDCGPTALAIAIQYQAKIDNHFYLGIRSHVYYVITANYFETVTLTPTLTYVF